MSDIGDVRTCDYCQKPIKKGEWYYLVTVPGTDLELHAHSACRDADEANVEEKT